MENRKVNIFCIHVMGCYLSLYFQKCMWVGEEKDSGSDTRKKSETRVITEIFERVRVRYQLEIVVGLQDTKRSNQFWRTDYR